MFYQKTMKLASFVCHLFLGIADSSSRVEELEERISQLEAARDELEVSVEKLTKEKEALEEKVSEHEEKNKGLTEKNAELEEKVKDLEKEVEELRNELDEIGDGVPVVSSFSSDGQDVEVWRRFNLISLRLGIEILPTGWHTFLVMVVLGIWLCIKTVSPS